MYKLLHRVFGDYRISFRTDDIPAVLRDLTGRKILFWDFRQTEERVSVATSLSGAKPLLACIEEAGASEVAVKKEGLPFVLSNYRKRPGLIVGMLLGLALIFLSELFVWKIEVHGNTVLTDEEITEALADYGIRVGSYIPRIPVLKAQNDFLLRYRELSSFAINIKGTHLEIELLERTHAPELQNDTGISHIVSSEDGIVVSVEVAAGTAKVSPGDVVAKGQILIGGYTVNDRNVILPRHARGKITAHTYRVYSVCIPLQRDEKEYTGKTAAKTLYDVLGKEIPVFFSETPGFERFDAEMKKETVFLFGIAELPIKKTTVVYREYRIRQSTLTKEEAEALADEAFALWLSAQTEQVYETSKKGGYDEIQNAYVLNVSVVFEKEIGTEIPADPLSLPEELSGAEKP